MKRMIAWMVLGAALLALGGCVYGPGYYQRPGVVYDDGTATYSDDGAPAGYADGYGYYGPGYYYDPWCCYGGPWLGLGFYGGYYYGGHGYYGHGYPGRGGYYNRGGGHGAPRSGGHGASGSSSGGSHGQRP